MEQAEKTTLTYGQLQAANAELEAELEKLRSAHAELKGEHEWLLEKYRLRVQSLYGTKRERVVTDGQMMLDGILDKGESEDAFNEAEAAANAKGTEPASEEEADTRSPARKKYAGQKKDKLAGLPVDRIDYELPNEARNCASCGNPLPELAPTVSRRIEVIPAQVRVIETARHNYAPCPCQPAPACGPSGIVAAPMPAPALPHALATEATIAFVITQKYQFGLPLYRQQQQWLMLGVEISRQTMANWVISVSEELLAVLYGRMAALLTQRDILMADETQLQVLNEPGRAATAKSYMWLFRSGGDGPPIVLFQYQTTRAAKHPKKFLEGFHGYLCTDGYAGYFSLPGVTNVSCFMHARRYFVESVNALPEADRDKPCLAREGVAFCNELYKVERALRGAAPYARYAERLARSQPILDSFKEWLDRNRSRVAPKTHIGKAINYCLNLWDPLCAFLKDGRLEIDNGRSERSIKNFVVGRKGWLFADTPKGASASAIAYSIVETAKENGLVPMDYLTHVLKTLPNIDLRDQRAVDGLLPWSASIPSNCRQIHPPKTPPEARLVE